VRFLRPSPAHFCCFSNKFFQHMFQPSEWVHWGPNRSKLAWNGEKSCCLYEEIERQLGTKSEITLIESSYWITTIRSRTQVLSLLLDRASKINILDMDWIDARKIFSVLDARNKITLIERQIIVLTNQTSFALQTFRVARSYNKELMYRVICMHRMNCASTSRVGPEGRRVQIGTFDLTNQDSTPLQTLIEFSSHL